MKNSALKVVLVILILVLVLTAPVGYLRLSSEEHDSYLTMAIAIDRENNTHIVWRCIPSLGGGWEDIWDDYRYGLHYRKLDKNMNIVIDDVKISSSGGLAASISVDSSQNAHIVYSKGRYCRIDSEGNIIRKDVDPSFHHGGWPLLVTHNDSIHLVRSCWDGVFYAKLNKNMSLIGNVTKLKLNTWAVPRYAGISMTSNDTVYICSSGGENLTYTEIDKNMNVLADNEKAKVILSTSEYHIVKDRYDDLVYVGIGCVDSNNEIHKFTGRGGKLYHQKIDVNGTVLTENVVLYPMLSYGTQVIIGVLITASIGIAVIFIILIKRSH